MKDINNIWPLKMLMVRHYTPFMADVLNDLISPAYFKIAGRKVKVRSLFDSWFTVDHYLFLKDDYVGLDTITIPLVCLASDTFGVNLNDEEGVEWLKKKALDVRLLDGYPTARYTWNCFEELLRREVVLNHEPTAEEVEAGIDIFKKYSDWSSLFVIARTLHITIEQVRKLPYSEAFLILNYLKDEANYQERYQRVILNKIKNEK